MERENKGNSLVQFIDNYTIIDLETTGFSPRFDDIIELGAVRVRNGVITEQFQQLVNPGHEIDEFITEKTGITDDMLAGMPYLNEVIESYIAFIGADVIVGHNVNFDINFLYDNLLTLRNKPVTNDYIDTMRLAKKLLPELEHHRLKDLLEHFHLPPREQHRSLNDCLITYDVFKALKTDVITKYESLEAFYSSFKKHSNSHAKLDLRTITATIDDIDTSHPLYGKVCVFTGALERFTRADAAQIVVNCGGIAGNGVTKKTNFLILGNNDYCKSIKDGKSSKQKKAELYIQQGYDLIILPEDVFYDMISE